MNINVEVYKDMHLYGSIDEDLNRDRDLDAIDDVQIYQEVRNIQGIEKVLRQLVNELSPQERKVFQMKFWEHLSDAEIGCELGLQTRRVKKIINQCLPLVRERLLEEVYGAENLVEVPA